MSTSTIRVLRAKSALNQPESPSIAFHTCLGDSFSALVSKSKRAVFLLQRDDISIRLADEQPAVDEVGLLVTRMYRQRGYTVPTRNSDSADCIRRVTLEACYRNRTVGTLTLNLDGGKGLYAEQLYPDEVGALRNDGAKVCEFTRLALDSEDCSKEALACLFHLGFIFAYRIHKASDLLIEVNPRHSVFYRRRLGFHQIGMEKLCPRVDAPAVLLHKPLRVFAEELARWGGLRVPQNKSFYALGLSPWEENDLVYEIRRSLTDRSSAFRPALSLVQPTARLARSA